MKYILFLFPLLFVSCKQECDIPATSTEEQFTVQKCTDGIRDSVTVQVTTKEHLSICDCQSYCDEAKEATNNSLIALDKVIDNSKNPAEIQEAKNTKFYLLNYGPTCNCKTQ
jgi:hypothetical protein